MDLKFGIAPFLLAVLISSPLLAQQSPGQLPNQQTEKANTYPVLLDGTLSVEGDLEDDASERSGFLRFDTALAPWLAFKQTLAQDYGITIGGSYGVMWQNYQDSFIGEQNAVGSKFTLNTSIDLLNRGQPDALSFDMAIEDRRPLGTNLPPLWGGIFAGSATATAATWGEFDLGITQAYVRQNLFDNRFQYAIGKLFAPNFVNAYPFFDDNRQFFNQNFTTSPTIAVPLRGFGMAGALYPTDNNLYVSGGIYTPYSDDTGWTIDDFFQRNQYFYNLEVGFSGVGGTGVPIQGRGPMDANNYHISTWYRDELDDGTPEAYGVAFNANQMIGENTMWFLRGGWSRGTLIDRSLSAGVGYRPSNAPSDLFGFAVGWVRPSNERLDSQYTAEAFYRFHVTPQFAITPDVQLILKPTLDPTADSLWAFGLRARLSF
ncbi:carbohydrate porin [Shinella curvata]|uniref:Carbohydrate porin n=1 Tax=Shinella curvata TaxID=1817964 RepID=A0ABT8XG85_9HYPH|nr:carbohydrate porin [Shinella curvata]MCJ8053424.1 carbohydrate porin [Shinella curvata]MDO6122756.1 carbohydrate porin [Shinella curvata]